MGIKFYCPNGHKLNVKTFLGGKKAICPKCGAKVLVPLEGATGPATTDADEPEGGAGAPGWADAAAAQADAGRGALDSAMAGWSPTMSTEPFAQVAPQQPVGNSVYPGHAATAPGTTMIDPIDEAPTAVWYVRPPSGGQYGPAAGPTMRAWIQEGRVTANSLVWRDGWPEWRSAAATFPSLSAGQAAWGGGAAHAQAPGMMHPHGAAGMVPGGAPMGGWQQGGMAPMPMAPAGMAPAGMPMSPQAGMPMGHVMSALETPLGGYETPVEDEPMTRKRRSRGKKGPDITTYVSAALVVMTIILVIVLAIVLFNQKDEEGATPAKGSQKVESSEMEETDDAETAEPAAGKKDKKGKRKPAMQDAQGDGN